MESIIELTVYALDGLIFGLCTSKICVIVILQYVMFERNLSFDQELQLEKMTVSGVFFIS